MSVKVSKVLGSYKTGDPPTRRADGRWIVGEICAASALIALGHEFSAIEDVSESEKGLAAGRVWFIFEQRPSFEADYARFAKGEPIPIRKFLDSFFALVHIARSRFRRQGEEDQAVSHA